MKICIDTINLIGYDDPMGVKPSVRKIILSVKSWVRFVCHGYRVRSALTPCHPIHYLHDSIIPPKQIRICALTPCSRSFLIDTPSVVTRSPLAMIRLCDHGAGGGGLVAPGGWEDTDGLVVAGQTVDAGLDENQPELGVLVLAVALEVLADGDGLEVGV